MPQVVTLTMNPAVDKSAIVARVAPEMKLRCEDPAWHPGGGGVNVSRAIKIMGGDSLAVYPAGGAMGQMLQDLLAAEAVEQLVVPIKNMTRENFTAFDESADQQYRFGMPGPTLQKAEWQACLNKLEELAPEYIVASGSLPPGIPSEFYAYVAQLSSSIGAKVIVDTSGEALNKAVDAGGLFLIKPNMREMEQLHGSKLEDEAQLINAAQRLIAQGCAEFIVVSLGAGGAILITDTDYEPIRSPTVPIRSAVGAGDSMVGGIVYSLSQGNGIDHAIRYGIAAGSAAVMTDGTQLCRREDVERLFEKIMAR